MSHTETSSSHKHSATALVVAEDHSDDGQELEHAGAFLQLKEAFQNKNIGRVLMFSFIDGGGHSIWNRQVFQVIIYQVAGDTAVGWMSAYSGFSQMIAAVIAGLVGDRIGRELILKAGCAAGLLAVATTMWGVSGLSLGILYFSQVMWGCYGGVVSTGTEAIFADSVSTGQRAYIYNLKWMVQSMSSVIGLLLTIGLLVYMGNEWYMPAMKKTMFVGLCYHVGAMLLLLTLKQKYALGDLESASEAAVTELAIVECEAAEDGKECPGCVDSPSTVQPGNRKVVGGSSETTSNADPRSGRGEEDVEKEAPRRAAWGEDSELPCDEAHVSCQRSEAGKDSEGHCVSAGVASGHLENEGEEDDSASDSSSVRDAEGYERDASKPGAASAQARRRYRVSTRRTLTPSEYSIAPQPPTSQPSETPEKTHPATTAAEKAAKKTPRDVSDEPSEDPLHIVTADRQEEEFIGEVAMIRKLNEETEAHRKDLHERLDALPSGAWIDRVSLRLQFFLSILLTWECVPYFVCLVDFLVAIGSGMTVRYLSLFFVEAPYNVKPALLLTGELIACPLQAIFSYFVQQMGSYHTGRLPATVFVRGTGTTLLLIMGITHNVPVWLVFPMYVVRNSLMNSTAGITRSVIMDAVKKENRAKWSAFESFSSFTWAGSAVIGGYIAEAHGHQFTFAITAVFHYLSLMALIPAMIGAAPVERQLMHFNRLRRDRMRQRS